MLSRLHRKDHPLPAVVETLRIRENKVSLLKMLDMYNPRNDYFHPSHPRNQPRKPFSHFGTITGRMSGKHFMTQNMLSHMLKSPSSKGAVTGCCIHDEFIADYAKLEELVAASIQKSVTPTIPNNMLLSPALSNEKSMGFVASRSFGHVLRGTKDIIKLSGGEV